MPWRKLWPTRLTMPGNSLLVLARIVPESKPWWSEACQTAFDSYSVSREKEDLDVRFAVLSVKPSATSLPKGYKKSRVTNKRPLGPDGVGQAAQKAPRARQSRGMVSLVTTLSSCGMPSIAPTTLLRAVSVTCPCLMTSPDEPVREWAPFLGA